MAKENVMITISDDYYTAYLSVTRGEEDPVVTEEDVMTALSEKYVVFGIDKLAIRDALAKGDVVNEVVAKGDPHANGENAEIIYNFDDKAKGKPEVMEDGTVNFKNLGTVLAVKAGGVLAEKKPATKGKNGTTVTGRTIPGRDGRDAVLGVGKNTHLSEDGLKLISDIDGRIQFDGRIASVNSVMEIQGDVGVSTGNLSFVGSIVVNGNICDGYEVKTTGDLTVNGVVEGAVLEVGGNLLISRGIQGHDDAHVSVDGNMVVNFINSANVTVGGDIEANSIMSSVVKCDGNVKLAGKQGQLVGGDLICKGNVEAKTIGSDLEVLTEIKLGLDAELVEEMKKIVGTMKDCAERHDRLGKDLQTMLNKLKLTPDNDILKIQLGKAKREFEELESKKKEDKARLAMLQELANSMMVSQLKAGMMYPGVRVRIGNSNYYVKFEMANTILKRVKGEIEAVGF